MRHLTIQLEVEAPDNLMTDCHLSVDVVGWVDMRLKGYDRRHLPIVKQMVTEECVDPKALKPGDRIIRADDRFALFAQPKTIQRRKDDDTGWWLDDSGHCGICDDVLADFWVVVR